MRHRGSQRTFAEEYAARIFSPPIGMFERKHANFEDPGGDGSYPQVNASKPTSQHAPATGQE
jgi:hypothetical protein